MKKYYRFSILLIIGLGIQQVEAKIWRVNNLSNYNGTTQWGSNLGGTQLYPVFKEINQAVGHTSVNNGDTLHVEGSQTKYDNATITKRLVIIGAGYYLPENVHTSYNLYPTEINWITFSAAGSGSNGSQLIGVWVNNSASITIGSGVSNILIKRCRIDYDINLSNQNISDVRILQNYFTNISNSTNSALSWNTSSAAQDVIFNNNICKRQLIVGSSASNVYTLLECKNNVFDPPTPSGSNISILMNVGSFQNNILKNPSAIVNINNGTNLNVSFNTAASPNQFGTTNNNVVADMTTLFVDPALNSTDGDYQLRPGSAPGSDGADRGAFGGVIVQNRYQLSGLAAIPVIYEIQTNGVATPTGLPVTIKARTIQ